MCPAHPNSWSRTPPHWWRPSGRTPRNPPETSDSLQSGSSSRRAEIWNPEIEYYLKWWDLNKVLFCVNGLRWSFISARLWKALKGPKEGQEKAKKNWLPFHLEIKLFELFFSSIVENGRFHFLRKNQLWVFGRNNWYL